MTVKLPEYSSSLVSLVRAYDLAELTVLTSRGYFEYQTHVKGDGSRTDFAHQRLCLLEKQLKPMKRAINTMIQNESCKQQLFRSEDFVFDRRSNLLIPDAIRDILSPYDEATFDYVGVEEGTVMAREYSSENYVLLFEDEGFVIPRTIPKSTVEIWWRRLFYDESRHNFYEMALIENDLYGWDIYGHEC